MIAAAHVVLGAILPDGSPPLPEMLGEARVWSAVYRLDIGGYPAWEYRDGSDSRFVVIQRVAIIGDRRAVWIAYVPAAECGEVAPLLAALAEPLRMAGVLDGYWPVDADGTIPAVDSPDVLGAWPTAWRARLDTDAEGAPPSGPRIVGAVLA